MIIVSLPVADRRIAHACYARRRDAGAVRVPAEPFRGG